MRLASLDYHYSALGREQPTAASHARWHSVRPGPITRWHASMVATARLGCPCDACDRHWLPRHCFAASRRVAPCLWQSHPCHSPVRGPPWDSSIRLELAPERSYEPPGAHSFFARRPRTHLDAKTQTVRRRIASYTAAAAQRRYANNSRCALRYAGCRARCPKADINRFPESCLRAARATAYGCDP